MATYREDFGTHTAGSPPTGWTERWHTDQTDVAVTAGTAADNHGEKYLRAPAAASLSMWSWDAIDSDADRDDVEVLIRMQHDNYTANAYSSGIAVRGSGTDSTEEAYVCALYYGNGLSTYKYVNSVYTALPSVSIETPVVDVWYWKRFRVNGTTLSSKVWKDGVLEPEAWQSEKTDSSISAAGWVGVLNRTAIDIDYISVGTNGDTAPFPVNDTANTLRDTNEYIEALLESPSTGMRLSNTYLEALLESPSTGLRNTNTYLEVLVAAVVPAQFSDDWSGHTPASAPTGFTKKWHTTAYDATVTTGNSLDHTGDMYLQGTLNAGGLFVLAWDEIASSTVDAELLIRYKQPTFPQYGPSLWFRGSGTDTTETGYFAALYYDNRVIIGRYLSGAYSLRATGPLMTPPDRQSIGGWHWLRVRASGSTLSVKSWSDGQIEPPMWELETTDTNITAGGFVGINPKDSQIDYLSAGTNGATAPMPADDNTVVVRNTNNYLEVLEENPAPTVRHSNSYLEALIENEPPTVRHSNSYIEVLIPTALAGGSQNSMPVISINSG